MNTTAIRLVFVETNAVFDVTCKILTLVVAFFECACVNSTLLGRDSLPVVLILLIHNHAHIAFKLELYFLAMPLGISSVLPAQYLNSNSTCTSCLFANHSTVLDTYY